MAEKSVYAFGGGSAEGDGSQKVLLGGKGAGLAEMSRLGIPVPPGFTIATAVCTYYQDHDGSYPDGLADEVAEHLARVEELTGQRFGDPANPLLVSVRSGAPFSMPGMLDTILNLGLSEAAVAAWIERGEDARFVLDAYRRLLTMYGDVVLGVPHEEFEKILGAAREAQGAANDAELTAESLRGVAGAYKQLIAKRCGRPFPDDPQEQLWGAIGAVFASWNNPRAREYRKIEGISADVGTAVNVQSMVFGNRGNDCATGVAFTRNPATGERRVYGEYLTNAQGEDVVAGIRTPKPIVADDGEGGPRRGLSRGPSPARGGLREARAPLPRYAGRRVHHPARRAVPAADAVGQADRAGGRAHRARNGGGRGADRPPRGDPARPALAARAAPGARFRRRSQEEGGGRGTRSSATASRPARAPRPARSPLRRNGRPRWRRPGRCCWCGPRPRPRTSSACTSRPAS